METLTKENFWDEMEQKYPMAMAHFKEWIDKYKKDNGWYRLFNTEIFDNESLKWTEPPKYHELPVAMQFGIFIEYIYFAVEDLKLPVRGIDMAGIKPFIDGVKEGVNQTFEVINPRL